MPENIIHGETHQQRKKHRPSPYLSLRLPIMGEHINCDGINGYATVHGAGLSITGICLSQE